MTLVPTRLLVLKRLQALIEGVSTDMFDLTDRVYRGRNVIGEDVGEYAIGMIESPRVDAAAGYIGDHNDMMSDQWVILINGKCKPDSEHKTDRAYWLQAAVQEQLSRITATNSEGDPLYPDHWYLGGLITDFKIGPPVVRPPEDVASASSFFFQPLRLEVSRLVDSPYTQV